jgi:sRNA-binding protein
MSTPAARRLARYAAIGLLMEKFPAALVRYGERRPLKVGIRDDLVARGVERSAAGPGCNLIAAVSAT